MAQILYRSRYSFARISYMIHRPLCTDYRYFPAQVQEELSHCGRFTRFGPLSPMLRASSHYFETQLTYLQRRPGPQKMFKVTVIQMSLDVYKKKYGLPFSIQLWYSKTYWIDWLQIYRTVVVWFLSSVGHFEMSQNCKINVIDAYCLHHYVFVYYMYSVACWWSISLFYTWTWKTP